MKKRAEHIFRKALEKNKPAQRIHDQLRINERYIEIRGEQYRITNNIYVIGVGKASRPMVTTLKTMCTVDSSKALYITVEEPEESFGIESTHPAPDRKSVEAAEKLIQFIKAIPAGSTILFALSGGASSLICKPAGDISVEDVNKVNKMLLESGAVIEEINAVRKHLSLVKGGQLLTYFPSDCTLVDIIISDVPGNKLEIIGSGPTTPDSSTFQDAYDILLRYDIWEKCPASVRSYIEKGLVGEEPETLKAGDDPLRNHHSHIIGSARIFANTMADIARDLGYTSWVAEQPFNASVQEVANRITDKIEKKNETQERPYALIFYGETTVKVTGSGKGGRNQELALRGAMNIAGMKNICWLSAGTDGIDGPTDAAGAVVDAQTISKAEDRDIDAQTFLNNNDSYHFHEQMGALIKTGPTGNNVMDVVLILCG